MQYGKDAEELFHTKWDISFIGCDLDERCNAAKEYIATITKNIMTISYKPTEYCLHIDHNNIDVDSLEDYFKNNNIHQLRVLIDCTSIGVAEFLIIAQALYNIDNKSFDVLYLEPQQYKTHNNTYSEKRNFELSTGFEGYIGIPGQSLVFERTDKAVFFCGYESERLDRTFEELDIIGKNSQLVFGIPPFNSGWDMNSYSNHISVIEKQNIQKHFYYCGAANPLAVCEKLEVFYNALEADERLFIIPIGTKPMAIGACIYKISKDDNYRLSILYDHPIKKIGRSTKISRWNLYNISL